MSKRKSDAFQQQIDEACTAMQNLKIPPSIQLQVRENMIQTRATLDQQEELEKFLALISPSLKHKVSICIFSKILVRNRRFQFIIEKKLLELQNMKQSLKKILVEDSKLKAEVE